jgi:hypothetical protein
LKLSQNPVFRALQIDKPALRGITSRCLLLRRRQVGPPRSPLPCAWGRAGSIISRFQGEKYCPWDSEFRVTTCRGHFLMHLAIWRARMLPIRRNLMGGNPIMHSAFLLMLL